AVQNRARLFAAQASAVLGLWSGLRADRAGAARHFRESFDELARVTPEKDQPDLTTRIPLVFALADVLEGMIALEEDVPPIRKVIDRMRTELTAMAPALGEVAWFQRERAFADAMA